ncbi:hypothetical protein PanWU01x14_300850 [Parasponia andersonii]|uniref:Uncharacterized protein n=1 Tax=Parasponia andersonii TaxID=3476 RepID=A0A2P5ATR7_PARAD|nr:hypothetical protein PanWU01x14_300850 [Parasponia andersonii]
MDIPPSTLSPMTYSSLGNDLLISQTNAAQQRRLKKEGLSLEELKRRQRFLEQQNVNITNHVKERKIMSDLGNNNTIIILIEITNI